ncbi:MAG TPA: 4-(cytidine 5'-diphospho)-2-C-methyl-D-erythritol kinase, partial [Micromonosporaceae bacterium]|nr:4-(cytidine 5'-diphospho)-2-C-methyl-D-erythritol kinase [Micromonosporaceae bacterium]
YRELDRLRSADDAPAPLGSADDLLAALRQRDPAVLGAALGNDLQPAAVSLRPALAPVLRAGRAAGALAAIVSGSGPTCVFLAADAADAERIAGDLRAEGTCRDVWTAYGPVAGARVV